jgi:mono/diheme cytochrome c family protein
MPQLTDDEVGAIYAYLRSVPRLRNSVPRSSALAALAAGAPEGKRLYYRYACVSCHGDTGAQGEGDLTQAAKRFPTRDGLAAWIKDAPGIKPGTRMPAWKGVIAEHEYDALISYVLELGRPR